MTNEAIQELATSLLRVDQERDVIEILRRHHLWDDLTNWRLYGDRDGNYAVIGNQQSRPEAALVEKIVNSVDARLMKECLVRDIDPKSREAPTSVRRAVALFIEGAPHVRQRSGRLRYWARDRKREQSRLITLAVTGSKPRQDGGTSVTITDHGEGQEPDKVSETFLSIDRENKLRIPFVQGRFNMGGTGAIKFCGKEGLQLILTRRHPQILGNHSGRENLWSFTVVRRVRPSDGIGEVRNSVYRYLAPVGAEKKRYQGTILRFSAPDLRVLPEANTAYKHRLVSGSVVKLYEYDMKGFQSHVLRKSGLMARLELMVPGIALPVRIHECRSYRGNSGSFDTTLVGLVARLEENKGNNLEPGFPSSAIIQVRGKELGVEIYAFKPGKAEAYRSNEAILFLINGQTHATLLKSFFRRRKVKMARLSDSILVIVDCSKLPVDAREDLFMNSRDRLSDGKLRKQIERELEDLIGHHAGLKLLREQRRRSEIDERLQDSKPLEDVLREILRSSPNLDRLFLRGQRINRPHRAGHENDSEHGRERTRQYAGSLHPSYFRFKKKPNSNHLKRDSEQGRRCRIAFETDVVNNYFKRASVPGRYDVSVLKGPIKRSEISQNLALHDGVASWNLRLPDALTVGEKIIVKCQVTDDTLNRPFQNTVEITIKKKRERPSGPSSHDRQTGSDGPGTSSRGHGGQGNKKDGGIKLPNVHRVKKGDDLWRSHGFTDTTGCKAIDDSDASQSDNDAKYTFYVNTSNVFLQNEMKHSGDDPRIVEDRFVYANVLVGLGVLNDSSINHEDSDESSGTSEDRVASTTEALAPILLPMISFLGSLEPTDE